MPRFFHLCNSTLFSPWSHYAPQSGMKQMPQVFWKATFCNKISNGCLNLPILGLIFILAKIKKQTESLQIWLFSRKYNSELPKTAAPKCCNSGMLKTKAEFSNVSPHRHVMHKLKWFYDFFIRLSLCINLVSQIHWSKLLLPFQFVFIQTTRVLASKLFYKKGSAFLLCCFCCCSSSCCICCCWCWFCSQVVDLSLAFV